MKRLLLCSENDAHLNCSRSALLCRQIYFTVSSSLGSLKLSEITLATANNHFGELCSEVIGSVVNEARLKRLNYIVSSATVSVVIHIFYLTNLKPVQDKKNSLHWNVCIQYDTLYALSSELCSRQKWLSRLSTLSIGSSVRSHYTDKQLSLLLEFLYCELTHFKRSCNLKLIRSGRSKQSRGVIISPPRGNVVLQI